MAPPPNGVRQRWEEPDKPPSSVQCYVIQSIHAGIALWYHLTFFCKRGSTGKLYGDDASRP